MSTTLYSRKYFSSQKEAEEALRLFAEPSKPLKLPEHGVIDEQYKKIRKLVGDGKFKHGHLLEAYQKLRRSHDNTDVYCAFLDLNGNPCGSLMDIEASIAGTFYRCQLDPKNHRCPV